MMASSSCLRHERRITAWPHGGAVGVLVILAAQALFGLWHPVRGAAARHDPSVADIIAAHRSAVESIHSLRARLVMGKYATRADQPTDPQAIWKWAKQNDQERIRTRYLTLPPRVDGLPGNLVDVLLDARTFRLLENWNPEDPQEITPMNQGSVYAARGPRDRSIPGNGGHPAMALLFAFQIDRRDDSRTLWELVDESPAVSLVGRDNVDGQELFHLAVQHPTRSGVSWDVFLDPTKNFLVRRTEQRWPNVPEGLVRYVTRFQELDNGTYFPTEVEVPGKNDTVMRITVEDLLVNQRLPSDALDFRFPEHVLVRDFPAQHGKVSLKLWGPNDEPIKTITERADLYSRGVYQKRPSLVRTIAMIAVLTIVMAAAVWTIRVRQAAV